MNSDKYHTPIKRIKQSNNEESFLKEKDSLDLDKLITDLLNLSHQKPNKMYHFKEEHIVEVLFRVQKKFEIEPAMIEIETPIKICGDTHGQFYDLLRILNLIGTPPSTKILFLGDYVDRGRQSIEVIILLFALKIKYPDKLYLVRGNHEVDSINRIYGFYDECKRRHSIKLWKVFGQVFSFMPICALIDKKVFCMHGGISPDLVDLNQLKKIKKPIQVEDNGMICDILWSDPTDLLNGWGENERGVSYVFGVDVVNNFLKSQNLDLIVRAHQVVEDGYEFFAKKKLVTIFSAPNYCDEFDNSAGVLNISKDLLCKFTILRPVIKNKF